MYSKSFFYDFGKAIYHVDSFYTEFAKQSNVSSALLWVLYALNDGKPHTQIEVSNDWKLPKTTVNTVVKELEQNGYVELIAIKGKRREMSIVLTKEGEEYADSLLAQLYKKEAEVFKALTQDDKEVIKVLEKITKHLKGEE
ncbi:MAG: MarR family transcriptional regulator [Saccharofermentans sp.]|nr:MarR family transcriptional regulator [Saccharofermentans sp.]